MSKCEYIRTASGRCHQQNITDGPYCYYHTKVKAGLIDADEKRTLYETKDA